MTGRQASLDTNVILRWVVGDIPEQQRRAQRLFELAPSPFRVSDAIWAEVVYALESHYGKTRAEVSLILTALVDFPEFFEATEALQAACEHYLHHPKLSFTDCLGACRAAADGAGPLYTFDEKLAKQHPAAALVP